MWFLYFCWLLLFVYVYTFYITCGCLFCGYLYYFHFSYFVLKLFFCNVGSMLNTYFFILLFYYMLPVYPIFSMVYLKNFFVLFWNTDLLWVCSRWFLWIFCQFGEVMLIWLWMLFLNFYGCFNFAYAKLNRHRIGENWGFKIGFWSLNI